MSEIEAVTRTNKRRRDPERTREAILEVAGKLLASDGPEGLSVSKVAQIVGVNRGTAYHHFQTRDQLLSATVSWVSEKLCRESFGDTDSATPSSKMRPGQLAENLAKFAIENPEYGRVWLVSILDPVKRAQDPYWKRYTAMMEKFVKSDLAEPGIDTDVHSMMMVVGSVLWPVWSGAAKCSNAERDKLVKQFTDEVLRLNLNGIIKGGKLPDFIDGESSGEDIKW